MALVEAQGDLDAFVGFERAFAGAHFVKDLGGEMADLGFVDGDGAFTMRILVPTDVGEYSVYVHRTSESTPWAVEQITPLASE